DQDAAEAVAGASFYTMASLVEKALLRLDSSGRYQIHELLRQFAETKLAESDGEKESRSRHAAYYLRFVYERQDILLGPSQMTALDEIGRELENIRAGWMWAVAQREWQSISRAVEGLHTFFAVRSRYFEGQELLETALALLRSVPIEEEDAEL